MQLHITVIRLISYLCFLQNTQKHFRYRHSSSKNARFVCFVNQLISNANLSRLIWPFIETVICHKLKNHVLAPSLKYLTSINLGDWMSRRKIQALKFESLIKKEFLLRYSFTKYLDVKFQMLVQLRFLTC